MKNPTLFILNLLVVIGLSITPSLRASQVAAETRNKMPLAFTKNMGQWDERVLFRANAGGATMWFTREGVTYQFIRHIKKNSADRLPGIDFHSPGKNMEPDGLEQLILAAKFIGANPDPEIVEERLMDHRCSYYLGNDPTKWHTDVPSFEAFTLRDIYPGIELRYSGDGNGQATYEFVAAPGTDIAQVKVQYEGAEETSIDFDGKLILRTKWGDMVAAINSPTAGVLCGTSSFTQLPQKAFGSVAVGMSPQALDSFAIGPSYSTYLGGGSEDFAIGIAVDGKENAYVTGRTESSNFPVLNPNQLTYQGVSFDAFVTKLSSSGSLIYSTYLGGGNEEQGYGIAVDSSDNAYVTGLTGSSDFPTLNPFQTYQGVSDAFVTKLSSSGSLIYSTCLGGAGDSDWAWGIAVDWSGNAYVTGFTGSSDFPTLNPYQATHHGGYDAFVTKFSSSGASLIYSSYLGGGEDDYGEGITVDGTGNAYVTGRTFSPEFPNLNPFQSTLQGVTSDAFVTKLSSSGASLVYSTYLGGEDYDEGNGIAVDGDGNAYVTGVTYSSNFPTLNPYQSTYQGGEDVFVTKLSGTGNSLLYSTYVGGGGDDVGRGIAVDGSGNANVTGYTSSSSFPTLNPYQGVLQGGTYDAFVTRLSSSGASVIYSTYLGGGSDDFGVDIAVDGGGNAYVTGKTSSSNFPTRHPFQTYVGSPDAFVTRLSELQYQCGDANGSGLITISDAVYVINFIFSGGPAPNPLLAGDGNCSGVVSISDAVYLINYIFAGGTAPCAACK